MPLNDGYGVLIGRLYQYYCDTRRFDHKYYHCNLKIKSKKGYYRCAIDLDSKHEADGVQWRVIELGFHDLKGIAHRQDGWYDLEPTADSGALDYYRSSDLQPTERCVRAGLDTVDAAAQNGTETFPSWKHGTGADAFRDIEPILKNQKRLYIFGEPFRRGKGVHNIHQNQGDPVSSRWASENGPWQDGAMIAQQQDNSMTAFLCKFKPQNFFCGPDAGELLR
jgi:hypothetical protein